MHQKMEEEDLVQHQVNKLAKDFEPSFETVDDSSFSQKVIQQHAANDNEMYPAKLKCGKCRKAFDMPWQLSRHAS